MAIHPKCRGMRRINTQAATVSQPCNHSTGQLLTQALICVHVIAASCLEQKSYPPQRDAYRISPTWEPEASNWSPCTDSNPDCSCGTAPSVIFVLNPVPKRRTESSICASALGLHQRSHFACRLLSSQNTQLSLYVLFLLLFPKHLLWATAEKGCCASAALPHKCLPAWTQDLTTQLFNLHLNVLPKRATAIETVGACNIKGTHFGYKTLSNNEVGGHVLVL